MFRFLMSFVIIMIFVACQTPTENPFNPEADSPLELGEVVDPPYGCLMWRNSTAEEWKEIESCCPPEVGVTPLLKLDPNADC
jgi:hypothetical protein